MTVDMTRIWSVWEPPVLSEDEVPNDMGNMRLDVRMELDLAWNLMRSRGLGALFDNVVLYWPESPKPKEPEPVYRFEISGPLVIFISVGAWSGRITTASKVMGVWNESAAGLVDEA